MTYIKKIYGRGMPDKLSLSSFTTIMNFLNKIYTEEEIMKTDEMLVQEAYILSERIDEYRLLLNKLESK